MPTDGISCAVGSGIWVQPEVAVGVARAMVSAPQLAISQVFVLMTVPEAVSAVMPTDIAEIRAR